MPPNKDALFCGSGKVDSKESSGCLSLIRDGATLIRHTDDILDELAPMIGKKTHSTINHIAFPEKEVQLDIDEQKIIGVLKAGELLDLDRLHQVCNTTCSNDEFFNHVGNKRSREQASRWEIRIILNCMVALLNFVELYV